MSKNVKEKLLPIPADEEDILLFKTFSKQQKWALAKLFRVAVKTLIFMEQKTSHTYEAALSKALSLEKRGTKEKI